MKQVTILDGGMGRELKRIGAPFSQPLWSAQALIEAPDFVRKAHQNFIEAGAQMITTNAYACVPFHLGDDLYQAQGIELAALAGQLARQAADAARRPVQVAGSIPPPCGSYRPDLFDSKRACEITQNLVDAQDTYVDLWIVETISSLAELNTIATVLGQSKKPVLYAFSLLDEEGSAKLRSGESVFDAAREVCKLNGEGILFNCSIPEVMEQAVQMSQQVLTDNAQQNPSQNMTLGVYANSFTPISGKHQANDAVQAMREVTPEDYLVFAKKWADAGANLIGGCCGIRPDHIEALSQWQLAKS